MVSTLAMRRPLRETVARVIGQLAQGGRLVIPVGQQGATQTLWRIRKREGKLLREKILPVRFVPFIHDPEGL